MLCRISCEACHLSCLWTDDPKAFLESVCLRYRHCQAKLLDEGFDAPVLVASAKRAPSRHRGNGKNDAVKHSARQQALTH